MLRVECHESSGYDDVVAETDDSYNRMATFGVAKSVVEKIVEVEKVKNQLPERFLTDNPDY